VAGLDLVTPAGGELLALELVKQHLNVDFPDDDALIAAYVAAAMSSVETVLKCSLLPTAWRYRVDGCFPCEIRLPVGPVVTTNGLEIKYIDDAGALQTLAPSLYQMSLGETGVIRPAYGQVWPSTQPVMDAVQVAFHAGFEAADKVPPAIKAALLLTIGHLYANREATVIGVSAQELPLGARNLLMPFVRFS
jgi:uncharacterized phiE125 gp8 family phage protein